MRFIFPLIVAVCLAGPSIAGSFRVIDGDTIAEGTLIYRLRGIDAPEAGQTCASASGGSWACGKAAIAAIERMVVGKAVACVVHGKDRYDRTLAVCASNGVEINRVMVSEGLAWSFRRYSHEYDAVEDDARAGRIGIWQAETEPPWDYRKRRWSVAEQEAPSTCPIKGNINAKGERIYHAPWSPWYSKTNIKLSLGERWFCSEDEALKAGWRPPQWGR